MEQHRGRGESRKRGCRLYRLLIDATGSVRLLYERAVLGGVAGRVQGIATTVVAITARGASPLLGHHLVAADRRAGRARSRVAAGHREATRSALDGARTARRLAAERGWRPSPALRTRRVLSTAVQSRLMRAYEGPRSSLPVHSCSGSWLHQWRHSHLIRRSPSQVQVRPFGAVPAGRGHGSRPNPYARVQCGISHPAPRMALGGDACLAKDLGLPVGFLLDARPAAERCS